jgi:hypothetical protein
MLDYSGTPSFLETRPPSLKGMKTRIWMALSAAADAPDASDASDAILRTFYMAGGVAGGAEQNEHRRHGKILLKNGAKPPKKLTRRRE